MAADDLHAAFAAAAAEDGVPLGPQTFDWLCEQGHVGLERVAKARRDPALVAPVTAALEPLAAILARLKGDVAVLHASRENLLLPVDLVHAPTGTLIEVDGPEHFTSPRLTALGMYPAGAALGFDRDAHADLCREVGPPHRPPGARHPRQGVRIRRRGARARLPRRPPGPGDARHGPPAPGADRGDGRRRGGRLAAPPRPPGAAARRGAPQQIGRSGSGSTATLTVRQTPQRMRTFFVM